MEWWWNCFAQRTILPPIVNGQQWDEARWEAAEVAYQGIDLAQPGAERTVIYQGGRAAGRSSALRIYEQAIQHLEVPPVSRETVQARDRITMVNELIAHAALTLGPVDPRRFMEAYLRAVDVPEPAIEQMLVPEPMVGPPPDSYVARRFLPAPGTVPPAPNQNRFCAGVGEPLAPIIEQVETAPPFTVADLRRFRDAIMRSATGTVVYRPPRRKIDMATLKPANDAFEFEAVNNMQDMFSSFHEEDGTLYDRRTGEQLPTRPPHPWPGEAVPA